MEFSVAGFTVIPAVPVLPLYVAVMLAVPSVRLVTRPFVPAALLTVATAVADELHVTRSVIS